MAHLPRLCVRLSGSREWQLVPFEEGSGWTALEATLLRAVGADARVMEIAALSLQIGEQRPCLLSRDAASNLRDMDKVQVELRARDAAPPRAAMQPVPWPVPSAPPVFKRKQAIPVQSLPRDARAAEAPVPSPPPAVAVKRAAARPVRDFEDLYAPPPRRAKVCERGEHAPLAGEKPDAGRELGADAREGHITHLGLDAAASARFAAPGAAASTRTNVPEVHTAAAEPDAAGGAPRAVSDAEHAFGSRLETADKPGGTSTVPASATRTFASMMLSPQKQPAAPPVVPRAPRSSTGRVAKRRWETHILRPTTAAMTEAAALVDKLLAAKGRLQQTGAPERVFSIELQAAHVDAQRAAAVVPGLAVAVTGKQLVDAFAATDGCMHDALSALGFTKAQAAEQLSAAYTALNGIAYGALAATRKTPRWRARLMLQCGRHIGVWDMAAAVQRHGGSRTRAAHELGLRGTDVANRVLRALRRLAAAV
jgi:hypothetical protein